MSVTAAASERRRTGTIILHRGVWRSISIGLSYEWAARAAVPRFPHTAAADSLHGPNPATRLFMGLHLFCPWPAGAGRVAPKGSRPRGGLLLPSSKRPRAHATTGHIPTCGVPSLPFALGSAWGELRWLFSHLIHFVSGQERTRLFPGQCSAYSNYTKQTSRTRA
jgi:hypothetical protein